MTAVGVRIGTRGSALALVQARLAATALARQGAPSRLVIIETDGDRRAADTAWGEGAFVTAIERALLDGRIDVAVHSAKDIPTDEDPGLRIVAYLARADARDALVVHDGRPGSVDTLAPGARVGTDSPRRAGFLLAQRPDLRVQPVHGNVDTRLRRLDAGEVDALVLACAGLDRLGHGDRIAQRLDPQLMPPAPGQGAIGLQVRRQDGSMLALTAGVDDPSTRLAVEAERAFLRAAGGGCRAPIGAFGTVRDDVLSLLGGLANEDGTMAVARRSGRADAGPAIAAALLDELRVGDASVGAIG